MAACKHEIVCVMHNPGVVTEKRKHVLIAAVCWCRPTVTCSDCSALGVPLSEQRAHVYPIWAAAPEQEEAPSVEQFQPPDVIH